MDKACTFAPALREKHGTIYDLRFKDLQFKVPEK